MYYYTLYTYMYVYVLCCMHTYRFNWKIPLINFNEDEKDSKFCEIKYENDSTVIIRVERKKAYIPHYPQMWSSELTGLLRLNTFFRKIKSDLGYYNLLI
jgi:hypothetical protein